MPYGQRLLSLLLIAVEFSAYSPNQPDPLASPAVQEVEQRAVETLSAGPIDSPARAAGESTVQQDCVALVSKESAHILVRQMLLQSLLCLKALQYDHGNGLLKTLNQN